MSIEVSEKPHARLGASGWHTWGTCPGSDPLSEGIPSSSSSYAKEGTAAHALLEKCLDAQSFLDAEEYLGEEIIVEGEVFVVDQDMADAVNSTIDIVRSYMNDGLVLAVEQMVPLAHLTGEEDALGTCDIAIVSDKGTTLTIADFKYGQGVMVYASEKDKFYYDPQEPEVPGDPMPNGQLAMYASGWLEQNGFMYEDITKVRLVIIQPRMEWHDEYEITIEQLREFEDTVREAAGRVELERHEHLTGGAELTLVPGEKQCKFCKAKGICPALRNTATKALTAIANPSDVAEFEDLTLPKKAAAVTVNEGVTNERLAEFMRAVPLIEEAIDAAQKEMLRRLMNGQEVPGFYLGQGRAGARKWVNEETARKELTKSGRLKVSEATVAKVRSPTEIEKVAKSTRWWAKVAPLIEQKPGGPKVCKEGDSNARFQIASSVEEFVNLDAPETIARVYDAKTGNATIVETDRGRDIVLMHPTKEQLKLAKPGGSVQALEATLLPDEDLTDIMG